jgi:hypothetical protein
VHSAKTSLYTQNPLHVSGLPENGNNIVHICEKLLFVHRMHKKALGWTTKLDNYACANTVLNVIGKTLVFRTTYCLV